MTDYIFQIKNSIPDRLCRDIIIMYELENIRYPGLTFSGLNKQIKNTTDMIIPKKNSLWEKIEQLLYNELSDALKKYLIYIDKDIIDNENNNNNKYFHFHSGELHIDSFMIQKYDMQKGKYVYHDDFNAEPHRYRVITFLWYLNDVTVGGETEFWGGKYNIIPETGKLILFPSAWSYPHRGKMPISNDKYIITGWFYISQK